MWITRKESPNCYGQCASNTCICIHGEEGTINRPKLSCNMYAEGRHQKRLAGLHWQKGIGFFSKCSCRSPDVLVPTRTHGIFGFSMTNIQFIKSGIISFPMWHWSLQNCNGSRKILFRLSQKVAILTGFYSYRDVLENETLIIKISPWIQWNLSVIQRK